jgi:hypothetical protein
MIEAFKRSGLTESQNDGPRFAGPALVSLTSNNDLITRKAMPFAQGLSTAWLARRSYAPYEQRCAEGQLDWGWQTSFFRNSDANIPQMHSYEVKPKGDPDKDCVDPPSFNVKVSGGENSYKICPSTKTETKHPDCYKKNGQDQVWNDTPFWVIGVDKGVIPNHTEIFQPGTISLLMAIVKDTHPSALSPTVSAEASSSAPQPAE